MQISVIIQVYNAERYTKSKVLKEFDVTIVTSCRWLGERTRRSSLFKGMRIRIEVIPDRVGIDTYKPLDQYFCREAPTLSKGKKIVDTAKTWKWLWRLPDHLMFRKADHSTNYSCRA